MALFNEDRKEEVINNTVMLLMSKDYNKLSMLDIAKQSKISKETLYKYFGNKTGLFKAIIMTKSSKIKEQLDKALQSTDITAKEVLTNVAYLYLKTILSKGSACVNKIAISESKDNPELAAALISNGRGNVSPSLCKYIDKLKNENILNQNVKTGEMSEILFGLAARDMQIRFLLNDLGQEINDTLLKDRAVKAVEYFFKLFAPTSNE